MKIDVKNNKIIWETEDYEKLGFSYAEVYKKGLRLPVGLHLRVGVGYVLMDGVWVFPGDQSATAVYTCDSTEEYWEITEDENRQKEIIRNLLKSEGIEE